MRPDCSLGRPTPEIAAEPGGELIEWRQGRVARFACQTVGSADWRGQVATSYMAAHASRGFRWKEYGSLYCPESLPEKSGLVSLPHGLTSKPCHPSGPFLTLCPRPKRAGLSAMCHPCPRSIDLH